MSRSDKSPKQSLAYRRRRRAQSHEDAMLDGEGGPPIAVPDHPLIPAGKPALITQADELDDLIAHVREQGCFAYDTEFIGELSYHPRICLIQIATAQRLALVDPLGGLDPVAVWEAVADPALLTIVHAGGQDLEPVVRHLDRAPANIFDVQIAAAFTGQPYPVSLRKLVHAAIGVQLGKAMTFTHWDHRPLSNRHQHYAADDVRYLFAIKAKIDERLNTLNHHRWVAEECSQLCDPALYRFDVDTQYLRVRGATSLDARRLTILRELVLVRDTLARAHDMPPKTLLKDDLLSRMAKDRVGSIEALRAIRGMPRPLVDQHGDELVEAVKRGGELPPVQRPRYTRDEESPSDRFRIDGLLAAASSYCLGQSIDPTLVLNRSDLAQLYRRFTRKESIDGSRLTQGWRGAFIGSPLEDLLEGRTSLDLRWTDGGLRVTVDDDKDTHEKGQRAI